jgi:hypothetical protein
MALQCEREIYEAKSVSSGQQSIKILGHLICKYPDCHGLKLYVSENALAKLLVTATRKPMVTDITKVAQITCTLHREYPSNIFPWEQAYRRQNEQNDRPNE